MTTERIKAGSKRIYCKELNKVFNSQGDAARELNLDQSNISKVCRGVLKTCGGYHFEFYRGGIEND